MYIAAIRHKKYQLVSKVLTFKKYPIEKLNTLKKFIRNAEYPINICNTQMNEKGMGNIPNCYKN